MKQIKILTIIIISLLTILSCKRVHIPDKPAIIGIASPIIISSDTTEVILSDYIPEVSQIKSIECHHKTLTKLSKDKKTLTIIRKGFMPPLSNLKIKTDKNNYDILVKNGDFRTNTGKTPFLTTSQIRENRILFHIKNKSDSIFAYINNQLLTKRLVRKVGKRYSVRIPNTAKDKKRTIIRIYSFNSKEGISNDLFIPLEYGKVVTKPSQLGRFDKRASILYFLMTDRFFNGKTDNDHPLKSKEVHPRADYHGGDIAGVMKKLKEGYFEKLGINTIWLSPITLNPDKPYGLWKKPRTKFTGYHGYWPISSSKIDYRYGTDKELRDLVNHAHEKGINVILDYVANHVHKDHPVYKKHPDWATNLYLPDGSLNTERWDDHRLTTWFDVFLPTLDLSKPKVVETMTDSALFWLKEYKLDGFRHDATKHIPDIFWRTLTKKIKQQIIIPEERPILQIGETYGSRELIDSYIGSGQLDGQFDFNVYDDAVSVFANPKEDFNRLYNSLKESFEYYGCHNLMGYITGNQDRARFISYASGDLKLGEDTKIAGWTRAIGVKDKAAYKKLIMLNAFMLTIPGIPTIYYGDEIGLPGGNDPDNRRMMRFDNLSEEEKNVKEITSRIGKLRRNNLPLIYGDFEFLWVGKNSFSFLRSYFKEFTIVVFNKKSTMNTLKIDLPVRYMDIITEAEFGSKYEISKNKLIIELAPNSVEIIKGEVKKVQKKQRVVTQKP